MAADWLASSSWKRHRCSKRALALWFGASLPVYPSATLRTERQADGIGIADTGGPDDVQR
jgi:hypothetical protein